MKGRVFMSQRVIDVTLTVLSDVDVLVFGLDDKKQYAYGRLCSVLDSMITTEITLTIFLLCSAASVLLGIAAAFVMTRGAHSTQSFCITIAVLPLAVQTVIMLVNGNLGAGVAVAGAFGLVRFRSEPGSTHGRLHGAAPDARTRRQDTYYDAHGPGRDARPHRGL